MFRLVDLILQLDLRGATASFIGLLGPSVLQLLYTVVAARALTPGEFGYLSFCVAVAFIMMQLAGLGSGGLVLKLCARAPADANKFLGQSVAWTLVTAPFFLAASVAIMLLIAPPGLPWPLALFIGFSELVSWRIAQTCAMAFVGLGRQTETAIVATFIPLARLITAGIVVIFAPEQKLLAFGVAYVISTFAAMVLSVLYTMGHTGRFKLFLMPFDFGGAMGFAATNFNTAIQGESDKLILAYFIPPSDLGIYAVATRIMDGAYTPTRALKGLLASKIYKAGADGTAAALGIIMKVMPLVLVYGIAVWIAIALLSPVAVLIFGRNYAQLTHILPLLAALPLLRSFIEIGGDMFLSSDRSGFQTVIQFSTTFLRIAITIALVAPFALDGAIAASLISSAAVAAAYWITAWILMRRHSQAAAPCSKSKEQPEENSK